jgi:hypothetical protein
MTCAFLALASPAAAAPGSATPASVVASASSATQADTLSGEPDPTDPASDPGSLPFTGSPLGPVLLAALLLLLGGLGVRRAVRARPQP